MSIINNQQVYIEKLKLPQVTDLNTTPSSSPIIGTLAFSTDDLSSLYVGNGSSWVKVQTSGSTGGIINDATITNSTISGLSSTGIVDSMLSGKIIRQYFTTITTGVINNIVGLFATIPGNCYTLKVTAQAYVTAGPDIGASASIYSITLAWNNGTKGINSPSPISESTNGFVQPYALAVGFITGSGTNVAVFVTGMASDTINWSGYIEIDL